MANKSQHIKEAHTHTESSASSATKSEPEKLNEPSSFPAPRERTNLKQTNRMFGKRVDHDNITALRDFEYVAAAGENSEVERELEESPRSAAFSFLELDDKMDEGPNHFERATAYHSPNFVTRRPRRANFTREGTSRGRGGGKTDSIPIPGSGKSSARKTAVKEPASRNLP